MPNGEELWSQDEIIEWYIDNEESLERAVMIDTHEYGYDFIQFQDEAGDWHWMMFDDEDWTYIYEWLEDQDIPYEVYEG
jgi:hypothetical protein